MRKKRWWALGLIAAIGAAGLAYFVWPRTIPGPPPLPSPNGYDDFVAAGALVVGQPPDVRTASLDQLRQFVDANQAVLDRLRVGLGYECGVPIEYTQAHISVALERLNNVRAAARVLSAEAKLAEKEGRTAPAARSYLDLIRLANELARGGLVIDRLMANAYERDGIVALEGLRTKFTGELAREALDALAQIDERAETAQAVIDRERAFQDALIADMGIVGALNVRKLRQMARSPEPQCEASTVAVRHAARLLLIELAIQLYVEETGSPPESLDDLVPRYLTTVPHDPKGDRPFEYHRDPSGFYSLGPGGAGAEQADPSKTP